MVSKKVDADISHFMKLAKSLLKAKTESDALRMILRGETKGIDTKALLEEAQHIAAAHGFEIDYDEPGEES